MWMSDYESQTLCDSPRPVRPENYPIGFDHDLQIPGWQEDDGSKVRSDCVENDEEVLGLLVIDSVSGAGDINSDSSVDRAAIICEFLTDVGCPELNFSGDILELRGYLTCEVAWDCT